MLLSTFVDIEDSLEKVLSDCEDVDTFESLSDTKDSFFFFFIDDLTKINVQNSLNEQLYEEIDL